MTASSDLTPRARTHAAEEFARMRRDPFRREPCWALYDSADSLAVRSANQLADDHVDLARELALASRMLRQRAERIHGTASLPDHT